MLPSSKEDQIANNYFDFANDFVGVMAFSLGIAALQFERPKSVAIFSFIVLLTWLVSKAREYTKYVADKYFPKGTPIVKYIRFGWRIKIYLGGMIFLLCIAAGWIDRFVMQRLEVLLP